MENNQEYPEIEPLEAVRTCAQHLEHNGGQDTIALDLRNLSSFTDYFVITTARSMAQLHGLARNAGEFLDQAGIRTSHSLKRDDDSGWLLFDCGFLVVHLMLKDKRQFYDLERLWYGATTVYHSESDPDSVSESSPSGPDQSSDSKESNSGNSSS